MTAPAKTERSKERKQFLFDVFVTALEGGIGYWSVCDQYHHIQRLEGGYTGAEDLDGFYAVIHEIDEDGEGVAHDTLGFPYNYDTAELRIDADVIARGVTKFKRYCRGEIDNQGNRVPDPDTDEGWEQRGLSDGHYWHQFLEADRTNGDDGDYDADVADAIVQFGLLGEIRYA